MQSVAVGWQIYSITHRPLDLGLAGLAQFLPAVCLFLVTGHVSDRVPRKRILLACVLGFAICSALLLALCTRSISTVYPIYAVLLMNGTVRAFNAPAAQSFLPLILPRRRVPQWRDLEFVGFSSVDHRRADDRRHPLRHHGHAAIRLRNGDSSGICAGAWALSGVRPTQV